MKIKILIWFLILALVPISPLLALTPVRESAEDLFWESPASIHNYKNRFDLHNLAASFIALTELEFVRLGDHGVSFVIRNKVKPFEKTADGLESSYHRLPQTKPVHRFAQLVDALQIRQFSLSDARFFAAVANGGLGGITPIMQTRISKLLVLTEDVIGDMDAVVMSPLDVVASRLDGRSVHIKSIAYVADLIGFIREETFDGLRAVNRVVMRTGSRMIKEVEHGPDQVVKAKRVRENKHFPIYVQMDHSVFKQNQKFFERHKHAHIASLEDWKMVTNARQLPKDLTLRKLPQFGPDGTESEQTVLVVMEYRDWRKAPKDLRRYVIDQDEFWNLVSQ